MRCWTDEVSVRGSYHLLDVLCQVNLAYEMPDKFLELVEQWDAACVDEVVSRFRPSDTAAFAVSGRMNVIPLCPTILMLHLR